MNEFKKKIEIERDQLIASWRWRLSRDPNWIDQPWPEVSLILAVSNGESIDDKMLGHHIRQFHNTLGFKAWGTSASRGGLCGGAIFRTPAFMAVNERRFKKKPVGTKTIHIEHTFPITMLSGEIRKAQFGNHTEALRWLLQHSVATATSEQEQHLIEVRYRRWSGALDPLDAIEYKRPFMRYTHIWNEIETVWNVLDGKEIDPCSFTFDEHLQLVCRVLRESGAERPFISAIS